MSDDPEILPPLRQNAPTVREQPHALSSAQNLALEPPRTVVSSWITGLQARMEARSNTDIATSIRARADAVDASTELGGAMQRLRQKAHELEELPDILSQDRTRRTHQRTEERAEMRHRELLRVEEREEELAEARRRRKRAQQAEAIDERLSGLENESKLIEAEIEKADVEELLQQFRGKKGNTQESAIKQARKELIDQYGDTMSKGEHTRASFIKTALDALDILEKS